jgi:alpha-glucosidase (family GH31 glycosyl hydrolase)
MLGWRRRLAGFLRTYADEIGDRGYPMIHPLAMQYPSDTRGAKLADQFLLGDEILVAPIYTESNRRTVYFPMGNWTDLRTNSVYPGRQEAEIEAPPGELPLFVRNGSILPLVNDAEGGPMLLHYTPKLAAEFFLYEDDINEYSQYHASPALDLMRLEIESHKARGYEWIVHHIPTAREVRTGETLFSEVQDRSLLAPGRWYYDRERENLHVAVNVPAGATRVTHIEF